MNNYSIFTVLLLVAAFLTACGVDIHDHPHLTTGKQLFEYHCSGCHNDSGNGRFLLGVPSNNDTKLSIGQVSHKIKVGSGISESKMPVFAGMSREEAVIISAYLKKIRKKTPPLWSHRKD